MLLRRWKYLPGNTKLELIKQNGQGQNWRMVQESMDYFDRVVDHLDVALNQELLPKYSLYAAREYLRWRSVARDGTQIFKISNDLTPDINVIIHRIFPEVRGVIECHNWKID